MKQIASLLLFSLALVTQPASQAGTLANELEGKLVRLNGSKIEKVPTGTLADKKIFAFYYSAHWCPPCRAFTPELVKEYKKLSEKHPEFELIFVSSDRDEKAMEDYMDWGKMSYPAISYQDRSSARTVQAMGAQGIPYLVVTDANGKELIGKGTKDWVHPSQVLPELKKLLNSDQLPAKTASADEVRRKLGL
jgi:nucleoredoxin